MLVTLNTLFKINLLRSKQKAHCDDLSPFKVHARIAIKESHLLESVLNYTLQ